MVVIVVVLSFVACDKTEPIEVITLPASNQRGALVSYANVGAMTANQIVTTNMSIGDASAYAAQDVNIYRVVYKSVEQGTLLNVSGLVMLPKNATTPLHLVQHHHGTIMPSDAGSSTPSDFNGQLNNYDNTEVHFIGALMASNGFAVSLPDYVGYGETRHKEHPYTHHHELAEVSVDMMRATKQLLQELAISFSSKVCLMGWSEGGGAGLATHKYLQGKYPNEFNLVSSSLFAGPYDYKGFIQDVMTNKNQSRSSLSIYSWAMYAMNKYTADLQYNTNQIWKYPVTHQGEAINVPSLKPVDVFKADFITNYLNGTDTKMVTAITNNSLIDGWMPAGHVYLHSGTADEIVPHYNSVNAYNKFNAVGANVKLYEYPGGDHYSPLFQYVTRSINDFRALL